ncbi:hypothetical protein GGX14DRAFT_558677 [Mycena pura]|uniref:DUF6533 domain-containing protein n=1 Tax=Mycena pura TaxID=153505 RepID=A0AAD6YL66_9AGAR|nr:hypothetical protein GGX14DRAFT_558677 [Mycena pura]
MAGPFNTSAPGHHPHGPVSPLQGPNALQGNALAALIWVGYDLLLVLDREIVCVWKSPWSATKILYLLLRCNGLLALSCVMSPAALPKPRPISIIQLLFHGNAGNNTIRRDVEPPAAWEWNTARRVLTCDKRIVFTVLLFANQSWVKYATQLSRSERSRLGPSQVGIVTTAITFLGGSERLAGSTKILNCSGDANNVPDLNVGMWCISVTVTCIYLSMLLRMAHILASENSMSIRQLLCAQASDFPIIHLCLRDACCYFIVVLVALLMNLVLITAKLGYAQIGTPWLIAAYTVTSTRIFLNLKDLARRAKAYNSATWSEFERASELNFRSL